VVYRDDYLNDSVWRWGMTEEEAKKRWCPMVRCTGRSEFLGDMESPAGNCDAEVGGVIDRKPSYALCIASDCMCWRNLFHETETDIDGDKKYLGGYCGLAGGM